MPTLADYLAGATWDGAPTANNGGYAAGQIQFTNVGANGDEHTSAMAINPKTGKAEPVYALEQNSTDPETGALTGQNTRYFFASDPDRPPEAQPFGSKDYQQGSWGSAFDKFMGNIGVPGSLAALTGAGALAGAGVIGAAGADAAAAGATGLGATGAAAAGGGDLALGSGLTAGAGGATGLTAGMVSGTGVTGLGSGITSGLAGNAGLTGSLGALGGDALTTAGLTTAGGALGTGLTSGGLTTGQLLQGAGAGSTALGAADSLAGSGSGTGDVAGAGGDAVGDEIDLQDTLDDLGNTDGTFDPDPSKWTTADWTRLIGAFGPSLLGAYGANQMSDAYTHMFDTLRGDRLPYLTASQGYLNDPSSYFKGKNAPGNVAINSTLRGLSVTGNPFGSPFKMEMAGDAGMRSWLNAVNSLGALGTGGETAQLAAGSGAINADASGLNALGYGLGSYFNPQPTLADLMRGYRGPSAT
jgi:hypothetical protein